MQQRRANCSSGITLLCDTVWVRSHTRHHRTALQAAVVAIASFSLSAWQHARALVMSHLFLSKPPSTMSQHHGKSTRRSRCEATHAINHDLSMFSYNVQFAILRPCREMVYFLVLFFCLFVCRHKVLELNADQGRLPPTSFNLKQSSNAYDKEE